MNRLRFAALAALLSLLVGPAANSAPKGPWRFDEIFGLPERLSITADHRTRYEYLDGQFRVRRPGDDEIIALRTRVRALLEVTKWLKLGAEFQDSRAYLADTNTPLNTGLVNAAELLRAYAEVSAKGPLGGAHRVQLGLVTMDVGSRRFIARNRYRNTSNAFVGIDWSWQVVEDHGLRLFYALPVQRRPLDRASLADNVVEHDHAGFEVQFAGLFYDGVLPWGDTAELYLFGLHERDSKGRPTRRRRLGTGGFRLLRAPEPGHFFYELETAIQFGRSRLITSIGSDLDHLAHFHHVELGYAFDVPWTPRLSLQYDYASGDRNPGNGKNGRFDTLYGARRFEFGPTSLYGPFARSNLNTPGLRLKVKPHRQWTAFVAYRAFWLAADRDFWTTSGVVDRSGDSGSFVGSQIELRMRWEAIPGNVRIEAGYAHLFAGRFIDEAPNSNRQGDSNYVYTQIVLKL